MIQLYTNKWTSYYYYEQRHPTFVAGCFQAHITTNVGYHVNHSNNDCPDFFCIGDIVVAIVMSL